MRKLEAGYVSKSALIRLENAKAVAQAHELVVDDDRESRSAETTRGGLVRALIVDDSSVMRKVVERALRGSGLELTEIVQASNGEEALQILRSDAGKTLPG